jgi:acetolactate decarboxylase
MIVNEGVCFHLFASGEARVASPDDLTPFAAVTTFEADTTFDVEAPTSKTALLAQIDERLTSENLFYGIRVTGHFSTMASRTATRQEAPYLPLPEATATEAERTFTDTTGVLVGFKTPDYEQGISVAGYHLHFLNDEHTGGGHAFDFVLDQGVVEISTVSELHLSLPTSGPFLTADLNTDELDAGIRKSEG